MSRLAQQTQKTVSRKVGALGDVSFSVSSKKVQTLTEVEINRSVNYASHKIHCHKPQLEYTGKNTTEISFPITLSAFLGVNARDQVKKLENMMWHQKLVPLVIGKDRIGKKWVITSVKEKYSRFNKDGTVIEIECTVSLKAYN